MSRRLIKLLLIVALFMLLAVPTVLASVRTEDDGQVPFYARIPDGALYHDGRWAAVVFYRSPSCVPADFNFLDFFDYPDGTNNGAFDCNPPTTDNFSIWKNGPNVDFAPLKSQFRGLGAVPIWFVHREELEAAIADGVLTISELSGLPTLMMGSASFYSETLRPTESHPRAGGSIRINSNGTLDDGRSFMFRVRSSSDQTHVRIITARDN